MNASAGTFAHHLARAGWAVLIVVATLGGVFALGQWVVGHTSWVVVALVGDTVLTAVVTYAVMRTLTERPQAPGP